LPDARDDRLRRDGDIQPSAHGGHHPDYGDSGDAYDPSRNEPGRPPRHLGSLRRLTSESKRYDDDLEPGAARLRGLLQADGRLDVVRGLPAHLVGEALG